MKRLVKIVSPMFNDESGNILILVAFAMIVLFGMTALTIDAGDLYQTRRDMVNAADAAALAGAQELIFNPGDKTEAENVAREYASVLNKSEPNQVIVEIPDNYTVHVKTGKNVEYVFARFLNLTDSDVKASATAMSGEIIEMEGLLPIGLTKERFNKLIPLENEENEENEEIEDHVFVKFDADYKSGNWNWVSFDANNKDGPKLTADYFNQEECPGSLSINHKVRTRSGTSVVTGNPGIEDALIEYIAEEELLFIPITSNFEKAGGGDYTMDIVGFAGIVFEEDYSLNPAAKHYLTGRLIPAVSTTGPINPGTGDSEFTPKGVVLVE